MPSSQREIAASTGSEARLTDYLDNAPKYRLAAGPPTKKPLSLGQGLI